MFNALVAGMDVQPHIRNFNMAWIALSGLEQTQLIEEFRRTITRASSADPGMVLSPAAYLWYFRISLKTIGCVTDEFAQFFGSYWLSPARIEIENQISRFFEGIVAVNHSPSALKLVIAITARATEALQK